MIINDVHGRPAKKFRSVWAFAWTATYGTNKALFVKTGEIGQISIRSDNVTFYRFCNDVTHLFR